jgi:hypothetical protein
MSKTTVILGATGVAVLVLAGCSHTTREIVTPVPAVAAAPPTVIVANTPAPPAPRVEVQTAAPGPDYVWQNGYWTLRNGQYEWVPGHWEATLNGGPN